ncbi:MAG: flavodoxin family protein [Coriobacteriales bacterium]|jgi:multimeric flavodoxin WrbA|nr:flavodoxin family protein [Coriobacteriales bacterium]
MADRKSAKKENKPDILFISGSPRSRTCVALIDLIEQGARQSGAKTQRFLLSKKRINPCIGCGGCNETGNCVFAGKTHNGRFIDDYLELKAVLERVDALAIVAPLYFAGPPAQLKALYDRMQPYWVRRYLLGHTAPEKRPAQLFVVGGGGDAHGHAPLVGSTKSALAVAGFNLEKVNNFIGFSAPGDVPVFPRVEALEGYSHAQLAQLKRVTAQQEGLVQRAIDAGGAFARFVVKKKQATQLAEQLAKVEAELDALRKVGDVERPEQAAPIAPNPRGGMLIDHKGELQAEIDLEYSNLISRTPRDEARGEKAESGGEAEASSGEQGEGSGPATEAPRVETPTETPVGPSADEGKA